MVQKHVFADEAGDFTFSRKENVSKYFILCSVFIKDDDSCDRLSLDIIRLRRSLIWIGRELGDYFHATNDKQRIRDEFFNLIMDHDFTVQATVMEKSKSYPHIRESRATFYKYGWFYHFKHGLKGYIDPGNDALVTAASIGQKKERAAFQSAVDDVLKQTMNTQWRTVFIPSANHPCLQVADYCAWAIQRKWERDDTRSYGIIKHRIKYEYDLWQKGRNHFY